MHEALGSDPESRYPSPHKAPEDSSVTLSEQAKTPTQAIQDHPQRHPPQLMSAIRIREHAGPWTARKRHSSLEQRACRAMDCAVQEEPLLSGAKAALHFTPPSLLAHRNPKTFSLCCPLPKKRASSQTFWYRPSSLTPAKSTLRTGLRYSCLYANDLPDRTGKRKASTHMT